MALRYQASALRSIPNDEPSTEISKSNEVTRMKSRTLAQIYSVVAMLSGVIALTGCGPSADSRYDYGFNDGYATGYNTTCEIRATLIKGDWKDERYSTGYRDGYSEGASECKKSRGRKR